MEVLNKEVHAQNHVCGSDFSDQFPLLGNQSSEGTEHPWLHSGNTWRTFKALTCLWVNKMDEWVEG